MASRRRPLARAPLARRAQYSAGGFESTKRMHSCAGPISSPRLRAIASHLTAADAAGIRSNQVRSGRDDFTTSESGAGELTAMSSCSGTNASAEADFGLFGLGVMGQNVA